MSRWMIVGAKWLMWFQVCLREVFWVCCCISCTLRSIFYSGKQALRLCWWLHFGSCCAIPVRIAVTGFMSRDLNRVSVWCDLWGMKPNASKTKTTIVSWSRTVHLLSAPLTLDGTVLKESADIVVLGMTFNSKGDIWVAPSLCFQSCSSEAWYHQKVLASISWSVTHSEIFFLFCPAGLGVLLSIMVLSCQFTSCQESRYF